jgi:hypothetical protein
MSPSESSARWPMLIPPGSVVVHDGAEVVVADIVAKVELAAKLRSVAFVDVLVQELNAEVAVVAGLLVIETDRMADLMNDRAKGTSVIEVDELLPDADHADIRAAAGIDPAEGDVVSLAGALHKPDGRVLVPMCDGVEDALLVRDLAGDGVGNGAIGPAILRAFDGDGLPRHGQL